MECPMWELNFVLYCPAKTLRQSPRHGADGQAAVSCKTWGQMDKLPSNGHELLLKSLPLFQ